MDDLEFGPRAHEGAVDETRHYKTLIKAIRAFKSQYRQDRGVPILKSEMEYGKEAAVIAACALSATLVACLLLRLCRSGKRIRKTRKYDIITTPAERVEMAPLNEDEDDDEDSTVFDVKYR
ncbi:membrane protein FAM174B [Alligator mississippiensis]|uniref:Membrane protein FAM174B n=1 Tax=Alligator mississippiensis TaxID=8496 RepID=A0A151M977_ALLMI|nr:membrane protein FAM174B [Alligator mississippiensis]